MRNLYTILAIGILCAVTAQAQAENNGITHYDKSGLMFDYPQGWKVDDEGSEFIPTVVLTHPGSVAQIVLQMQDRPYTSVPPASRRVEVMDPNVALATINCDFESQRKEIAGSLAKKFASEIQTPTRSRILTVTTLIGRSKVQGVQLQGELSHIPVSAAVYSIRLNRQFVSLVYVSPARDERAKLAWNTIRATLKVRAARADEARPGSKSLVVNDLNVRALELPVPEYPESARSHQASGIVTVQVTVNEMGNVIYANPLAGSSWLKGPSLAAARRARFLPVKLCGESVMVTGVITYNFVAR
jgi:hypothetical protein